MTNIVNAGTLGGGFRHYSGLLPANPGNISSPASASVRIFHVPATNAAALFRGDIAVWASGSIGVPGAGDLPANIGAPSTSVVIGNGGGSLLGNASMAPNISRWVPGDTTSVIAGVIVGWGPITLYQAKNSFQYAPASTECWAFVASQACHSIRRRSKPRPHCRFASSTAASKLATIRQRRALLPKCNSTSLGTTKALPPSSPISRTQAHTRNEGISHEAH